MALADAVAAEHGDPLAEPQLEVERVGQPVELELLDDHGPLAGAGAAEAHVDPLLADLARPLGALEELAQPALGGLQLRREGLGDLGPPAHLGDEVLEPLALVVVQRAVLGRACRGGAGGPRRSRRSRRRGVHAPVGLDGHELVGRRRQQLTVVADVEHRLAGRHQLALQPSLARDVEEVVGLVEQQHVDVPRSRTSSARRFCSPPENVRSGRDATSSKVEADGAHHALVPEHLGVVAAVVAPVGERLGVAHRVLGRARARPAASRLRRACSSVVGQRHEQLAHGGRRARRSRRPSRRAGASRRAGRRW